MAPMDVDRLVLVVTGASLRGEAMDRPLAYRLAETIRARLPEESPWRVLVVSDVLYLNDEELACCPVVSIGGPGVNNAAGALYRELPSVLTIDNVLMIQMDLELASRQVCIWGMNHEQTVQALELFEQRGYLSRFLEGLLSPGL